jgi:cathepsin B
MLAFFLFVSLAVCSAASAFTITELDRKELAVSQELIDAISAAKTTWQAVAPAKFSNATRADVIRLLGTIMPGEAGYEAPEVEKTVFKASSDSIPTSFDVRLQWPACAAITGLVRDQSDCGSCWAFGSTEAFNDRHCIATGDATTVFGAEDTLACCAGLNCAGSMGCNGGQPSGAWKWFTKTGKTFCSVL